MCRRQGIRVQPRRVSARFNQHPSRHSDAQRPRAAPICHLTPRAHHHAQEAAKSLLIPPAVQFATVSPLPNSNQIRRPPMHQRDSLDHSLDQPRALSLRAPCPRKIRHKRGKDIIHVRPLRVRKRGLVRSLQGSPRGPRELMVRLRVAAARYRREHAIQRQHQALHPPGPPLGAHTFAHYMT